MFMHLILMLPYPHDLDGDMCGYKTYNSSKLHVAIGEQLRTEILNGMKSIIVAT